MLFSMLQVEHEPFESKHAGMVGVELIAHVVWSNIVQKRRINTTPGKTTEPLKWLEQKTTRAIFTRHENANHQTKIPWSTKLALLQRPFGSPNMVPDKTMFCLNHTHHVLFTNSNK